MNLSQPKTREYVTGLLAEGGTPRTFATRVKRIRAGLRGASTLKRLRTLEI